MISRAGAAENLPRFSAAALALLLLWGTLTLWVRERWALSLFQAVTYLLGILWAAVWGLGRARLRGSFPLLPLAGAALWGLLQLSLRTTVYRFDTWNAVLFWTAALVLTFASVQAFRGEEFRERCLRLALYFAFAMSVLATTQYFTSGGKVFWLFPSGYTDAMGSIE